ncbi:hypothetical protein B0H34DRAFT_47087 [Crassisporium funariophilum]|nr:hypothetical protein B0H34DRAFT_47087 [Crassisporium funariophilum]
MAVVSGIFLTTRTIYSTSADSLSLAVTTDTMLQNRREVHGTIFVRSLTIVDRISSPNLYPQHLRLKLVHIHSLADY